jgi:putative DNA primase/helicase
MEPTTTFERIPHELRELRQWVLWRWKSRNGQRTKAPFHIVARTATDRHGQTITRCGAKEASSTDRETWMTYAEAVYIFEITRNSPEPFDGIGIVLTDGLVGLDLDKCYDATTGTLAHWAREIVSEFAGTTYAEVSPSGTGIKIVGHGRKPGTRCRTNRLPGFEVYDSGRFFTLTGAAWPGSPSVIGDCQERLTKLYHRVFPPEPARATPAAPLRSLELPDDEIIQRIRASRQAAKFEALWQGSCASYSGDHSAADLALCSLLAYWCGGDATAIDRLFRQSGLMRPKWDRADYRDGTIAKAVAGCRDFYRPKDYATDDELAATLAIIESMDFGTKSPLVAKKPAQLSLEEKTNDKSAGKKARRGENENGTKSGPQRCRLIRFAMEGIDDPHDRMTFFGPCNRINCPNCGPEIRAHFRDAVAKFQPAYVRLASDADAVRVSKAIRDHRKRHGTGSFVRVKVELGYWYITNAVIRGARQIDNPVEFLQEVLDETELPHITSSRDLAFRKRDDSKEKTRVLAKDQTTAVPAPQLRVALEQVSVPYGEWDRPDNSGVSYLANDFWHAEICVAINPSYIEHLLIDDYLDWLHSRGERFL